MTITYEYGDNLYVNTTNRCTCACTFCIRSYGDGVGTGTNLWLEREPTQEEILADIEARDLSKYKEIVFCGYGEPTYRIDAIVWVCRQLKAAHPAVCTRIDTNGHGNLINGRDITGELKGALDVISVSLNRSDKAQYDAICRPKVEGAFEAMEDFTRRCAKEGLDVRMTVVDNMDPAEIEHCRTLCETLGAKFRIRTFSTDWV